ncbi:hypothetical protein SRB17_60620 [Streptomyces sp. RB17]|uniref:hypothetical protein n=1 Tax=Streptomyces sp. RB17 TaxID=2585197 RepID=UPI001306502A|nr:hypothetical protein [Streptomyces sp. RB17]MQY38054.1 hypothetical protein [Streptomyces sp. RB17]
MSTTRPVAVTGHGPASVGRHLRVLPDTGPGGSVPYVRTAAGEVPVEASGAGTGDRASHAMTTP